MSYWSSFFAGARNFNLMAGVCSAAHELATGSASNVHKNDMDIVITTFGAGIPAAIDGTIISADLGKLHGMLIGGLMYGLTSATAYYINGSASNTILIGTMVNTAILEFAESVYNKYNKKSDNSCSKHVIDAPSAQCRLAN
jgi:hypothetical protein